MQYVPVPIDLLEIGKNIPVDLWDKSGKLLLRRGHSLQSEQHRAMLAAHEASMTEGNALAWTRGYERMLHEMLRDGSSAEELARLTMPGEIPESDYLDEEPADLSGGWLVVREVESIALVDPLRGTVLEQLDFVEIFPGSHYVTPADQLERLRHRALELLASEPDQCLFVLFQALADPMLGYCATHALLSAVVCELTAVKLGMPAPQRKALFRAALVMNIGMARAQDNPAAMVAGLREVGKLMGLYAPERLRVAVDARTETEAHRLERMSDAELVALAGTRTDRAGW